MGGRYDVPVFRIGRLGVDRSVQGRGLDPLEFILPLSVIAEALRAPDLDR